MFKKICALRRTATASAIGLLSPGAIALLLALAACRTPPLPALDLSEPGWHVRRGEAVWRANRDAPEIAGEMLLATNANGDALLQFTKTPFPLVVARTTAESWQMESPSRNKRRSGRGAPPSGVIWFQLPRALSGAALPDDWSWSLSRYQWRLDHRPTGEWLEGYFAE
jgi:hypothetical protein